ncbi:MAG TPA: FtsX-like permease family protein [Pyrinomonadaceae bacterium]|nr:FtsX-like permease family protein [Pyrinomonadaceae bacterium]
MSFLDILHLALRNLRQAKLRATLTTMGVIVGVAVIVTMVSFGLGLQSNMLARFKALDLFNEILVYGRGLGTLAGLDRPSRRDEDGRRNQESRGNKPPSRILDDTGIKEMGAIEGVAYVEPSVNFQVYVRSNGKLLSQFVGGANIPNAATRFQHFAAGKMISSPAGDEAVVSERFIRDYGYANAADAVGKTIELLAPSSNDQKEQTEEEETPNFFGIPLDDPGLDESALDVETKTFRIAGVLSTEIREGAGQGGMRGMMPSAGIYIPLQMAHEWTTRHRTPMSQVALALARRGGNLGEGQTEGYDSAVVRVTDPVKLQEVRQKITDLGYGSFSIVDELDQIRTVFLIIDSVLGLLGGISLLVASFGIANTMIMSILERTREIGIMKAIGAEDREIKLIFFVEAAVIGVTGGVLGVLLAWGIDTLANNLAYRFILKPQGASFIDFFDLPPYLTIGAILFALMVSIAAALYPASRAARIDPVRALRHD